MITQVHAPATRIWLIYEHNFNYVLTYDYAQVHAPATMTCSERKPSLLDTCIAADERGKGRERQRERERGRERGREWEGGIKSERVSEWVRDYLIYAKPSLLDTCIAAMCVRAYACVHWTYAKPSPLDYVCVYVLHIHIHTHTYTRMRLDFSPFNKTKIEHLSPCSRLWGW